MGVKKASQNKIDVDSVHSDQFGLAGGLESLLRRFKTLSHGVMLFPLYLMGAVIVGTALSPGVLLLVSAWRVSREWADWQRVWLLGISLGATYFIYGFCLIAIVPTINWLTRIRLGPWRGPYFSLSSVPWYIHNGLTYLVRYTFLEFLTPTPFNLFFYRAMGMKIGDGTIINSSHLSDPCLISLGRKVTIGGSVTVVAHYGQGGFLILAPVEIGDYATIGLRATIMGGAKIGAGAKILPNSVVLPKTVIPPGETWGGVPAQVIASAPNSGSRSSPAA